jgi:hypothetical protein
MEEDRQEYELLRQVLRAEKHEYRYVLGISKSKKAILSCLRNYLASLQNVLVEFVQFLKSIYRTACADILSKDGKLIGFYSQL